ncbi:MAG: GNAT family N-acetyltransferase [Anaerolineae bacterium]
MSAPPCLVELQPGGFDAARPIFALMSGLELTEAAVLDGEGPGRLFVDEAERPRSAFMTSPEGAFLVGAADNERFVRGFKQLVRDELFGRLEWRALYVTCASDRWEELLGEVVEPATPELIPRRHYVCRAPALDWRATVPDGYAVVPLDRRLLQSRAVVVPDHVKWWIGSNWGNRERFLERGFGFATVRGEPAGGATSGEGSIVSWSLADCRSGDACEIGIHTLEPYRQRGLATVTAAAAVEHALGSGYSRVGWHCNEDNLGSARTAEKIGFKLVCSYRSWLCHRPE